MRAKIFFFSACLTATFKAGTGAAASLPESYQLRQTDAALTKLDPALEAWIREHTTEVPVWQLPKSDFDRALAKQDQFVAEWLRVLRALETSSTPGTPQRDRRLGSVQVRQSLEYLERHVQQDVTQVHPMYPWYVATILRHGDMEPKDRDLLESNVRKFAPQSCSRQRRILEQLTPDVVGGMSSEQLTSVISDIGLWRSQRFRRTALETLARGVPASRRAEVGPLMISAAVDAGGVTSKFEWLAQIAPESEESRGAFATARKNARAGKCGPARVAWESALGEKGDPAPLAEAISSGTAIERCLRGRGGVVTATSFWTENYDRVAKTWGFAGIAAAKNRVAILEWTADRHEQARTVLNGLLNEARQNNNREVEAKSVYTLARIAEDLTETAAAIDLYTEYTVKFPDLENFEAAFMSLVTLRAIERKWAEAMAPISALISMHSERPVDERPIGLMSFALFWAGRVHLELGRRSEAQEMWRRLASEYYSTFYGALGHYLLEKSTRKQLALEPSRSGSFRPQSLRTAYSQGPARDGFDRVVTLLQIGMRNEAICEAAELDLGDRSPDKVLGKALTLHVAGEWLDAIKLFDALPRSFRNALPVGFERILFPRAWDKEIIDYSRRLGLDPDLVFALIRQESVYNPRAQSQVGAMGLMQLMPATAKLEAQRLSKGYLTAAEKKQIKSGISTRVLLDPSNNLRLGVHHIYRLLNKYKSPIFALAAYNASPNAAERWAREIPTNDLLAFIERIPYAETRAYVKLILRNYFYYKRWYETPNNKFKHLDVVATPLLAMATRAKNARLPASPDSPAVPISTAPGFTDDTSLSPLPEMDEIEIGSP